MSRSRARSQAGQNRPTLYQEITDKIVRRTPEDHSSDSNQFKGGADLFHMPEGKGAGVWASRNPDPV